MNTMTSRERLLTAMTGGVPDRVPCAPDTSFLMPVKRTGRTFWDVAYHGDPPVWKAFNDLIRQTGLDGFSARV